MNVEALKNDQDESTVRDYLHGTYREDRVQKATRAREVDSLGQSKKVEAKDLVSLSIEDQELVRKWETLLISHVELPMSDILFLMKTKLAFWIESFRNSKEEGPSCHDLRLIDGHACMKKEGRFVPISEIAKEIEYDPFQDKLISKGNSGEVWSYLSPLGLERYDRFDPGQFKPIDELSHEEYQKILEQASHFWSDVQPEVDVALPKKCILQVVTTNRLKSNHWALENLFKAYPEHATYRLITEDGKVYSFGFQMEQDQQSSLFFDSSFPFPLTFTKTCNTRIASPDYEESRPYKEKRITSIPVTQKRLEDILSFCNENNHGKLSFNFIRQNCATLGREVLKRAGVQTPERWQLGYGLSTLLPDTKRIPYIGGYLHSVVSAVKKVCSKVFALFSAITPDVVQEAIFWIPRKVSTLLANLFVCSIGGRLTTKIEMSQDVGDDLDNRQKLTCFSRLIKNWTDLFKDDLSEVDAHTSLIAWQMKQASTKSVVSTKENRKISFVY